jgi:hypothetical protein
MRYASFYRVRHDGGIRSGPSFLLDMRDTMSHILNGTIFDIPSGTPAKNSSGNFAPMDRQGRGA